VFVQVNIALKFFSFFFLTINRAIIFWWADWSRVMVKEIIDRGIVAFYRRSVLESSPKWRAEGKKAEERKTERGGNRTMA